MKQVVVCTNTQFLVVTCFSLLNSPMMRDSFNVIYIWTQVIVSSNVILRFPDCLS